MWLFTKYGFFSSVCIKEKKGAINPDRLKVRARRRSHLVALCKRFPNKLNGARIFTDDKADYRYRIFVGKRLWAEIVGELIAELNYDNFKNACPDHDYHDALTNVWVVMHNFQLDEPTPSLKERRVS